MDPFGIASLCVLFVGETRFAWTVPNRGVRPRFKTDDPLRVKGHVPFGKPVTHVRPRSAEWDLLIGEIVHVSLSGAPAGDT